MLLKRYFSTGKFFIRNQSLPVCTNCLHFIKDINNYPYDPPPNDLFGKCKKFGEINFITGTTTYDFASHCRNDEEKCGKIGSEYMPILKIKVNTHLSISSFI